jgi:hypothetical protein
MSYFTSSDDRVSKQSMTVNDRMRFHKVTIFDFQLKDEALHLHVCLGKLEHDMSWFCVYEKLHAGFSFGIPSNRPGAGQLDTQTRFYSDVQKVRKNPAYMLCERVRGSFHAHIRRIFYAQRLSPDVLDILTYLGGHLSFLRGQC